MNCQISMMKLPELTHNIDKRAFSIFRGWIRRVKEKYPEWDVEIENEQEIVKEFQNEVLSSLKNISGKEPLKKNLLDIVETLDIEARYPSHKERLMQSLTESRCKDILENTKRFQKWIKQRL